MRLPAALLLLCSLVLADKEQPLPTRKSVTLSRGGITYYVDGRQEIGPGTAISMLRGTKLVGRGQDPVLVVGGSFTVVGVTDNEVEISTVRIEPAARFDTIRIDMAKWTGGAGIVAPEGRAVAGTVIIDNTTLYGGVKIDLKMCGGEVRFHHSSFFDAVNIRAVPKEGKTRIHVTAALLNNRFEPRRHVENKGAARTGFVQGLLLHGLQKPVVRANRLKGPRAEFVDCRSLTFDGNKLVADEVILRHTKNGGFKGTKVTKCDVHTSKWIFYSPAGKKTDKLVLDKCWFQGLSDPKSIQSRIIQDGADSKDCGVVTRVQKINKRPLEIAEPDLRR